MCVCVCVCVCAVSVCVYVDRSIKMVHKYEHVHSIYLGLPNLIL